MRAEARNGLDSSLIKAQCLDGRFGDTELSLWIDQPLWSRLGSVGIAIAKVPASLTDPSWGIDQPMPAPVSPSALKCYGSSLPPIFLPVALLKLEIIGIQPSTLQVDPGGTMWVFLGGRESF